ncbi:Lipase member H, partial [Fragariocoptes setiger]
GQVTVSFPQIFRERIGKILDTILFNGARIVKEGSPRLCPVFGRNQKGMPKHEPSMHIYARSLARGSPFIVRANDTITEEMIKESGLRSDQPTMILIHGWLGSVAHEKWILDAKRSAFAANNQFAGNFILVDYAITAKKGLFAMYPDTFTLSKRLANMLRMISAISGAKPETFHCLGHSYGSHICGIMSREAFGPREVGRITGLDPGGFCYERGTENVQTYKGLRPTDAIIVDTLMSSTTSWGINKNIGQFNIRVNRGYKHEQCSTVSNSTNARLLFEAVKQILTGAKDYNHLVTCDHYVATTIVSHRLPDECQQIAYLCRSYQDMERGRCGVCGDEAGADGPPNQCYVVDYGYQQYNKEASDIISKQAQAVRAQYGTYNNDRRQYFLITSPKEPFCAYNYHIRIFLDVENIKAAWFTLKLKDDYEYVSPSIKLYGPWDENPNTLTSLLSTNAPVKFVSAEISVAGQRGKNKRIQSVAVTYMSSIVKSLHMPFPARSVKDEYSSVIEGDSINFGN